MGLLRYFTVITENMLSVSHFFLETSLVHTSDVVSPNFIKPFIVFTPVKKLHRRPDSVANTKIMFVAYFYFDNRLYRPYARSLIPGARYFAVTRHTVVLLVQR